MSAQGTASWDLYAKTMFNHFGHPLWHADPEIDEVFGRREVELGSVGYLDRGKFRHLFIARKAKDDPFNIGRVPATFEVFNPANMRIVAPQPVLRQPYVASDSVRQVVALLEGNASSPAASLVWAGGSLSFECKQDLGAVLLLNHPAMGQSIPTKRHIVTYLRRHIDSIYEYATGSPEGLGYDLKMHDIKFVSGTLKTTKWACAVMYGSYRNKMGSLNANVAGVGDFDMRVSIGDQIIPNKFYNNGPPSRSDPAMEGNSPIQAITARTSTEYDIQENPSDDGMDSGSGSFDPVVILLDYMLAKTDAEYAVASDRDILAIFGEAGVPDDIAAGLEAINPPIEVDENDGAAHSLLMLQAR
ncbi:hypothetical protein V8D89_009301 [Ganoderma adspersum]